MAMQSMSKCERMENKQEDALNRTGEVLKIVLKPSASLRHINGQLASIDTLTANVRFNQYFGS